MIHREVIAFMPVTTKYEAVFDSCGGFGGGASEIVCWALVKNTDSEDQRCWNSVEGMGVAVDTVELVEDCSNFKEYRVKTEMKHETQTVD